MKEEHKSLITYPTFEKYIVISCVVEKLRVKDKRQLFHIMRKNLDTLHHNSFFPAYGITAGEFAVWQILMETKKVRRRPLPRSCTQVSV